MQTSATGRLTMKRLLVWTEGPLQRLRLLLVIVESCNGFRGGALLNQIYSCMEHGDPFVHALATSLLDKVVVRELLSRAFLLLMAPSCTFSPADLEALLRDAKRVDPGRQAQ